VKFFYLVGFVFLWSDDGLSGSYSVPQVVLGECGKPDSRSLTLRSFRWIVTQIYRSQHRMPVAFAIIFQLQAALLHISSSTKSMVQVPLCVRFGQIHERAFRYHERLSFSNKRRPYSFPPPLCCLDQGCPSLRLIDCTEQVSTRSVAHQGLCPRSPRPKRLIWISRGGEFLGMGNQCVEARIAAKRFEIGVFFNP
jgi:hypothetical protein